MPKRVPHLIPLEPTELQDILIDTGESVVLELADDIEDEAKRYDQMGKMLRALWSTPGAISKLLAASARCSINSFDLMFSK